MMPIEVASTKDRSRMPAKAEARLTSQKGKSGIRRSDKR